MTSGSAPTPPGSRVYLDSASAPSLHPAARGALLAAFDQGYADPRRLHHAGRNARLLLDNAREVVASVVGARPDEVGFTRSGTDAIHRGLAGLLAGRSRIGSQVLASGVEHSAVEAAVGWAGGELVETPVDALGRVVTADLVARAGVPGVAAVALQSANHEVATTQPIAEVAAAIGAIGAAGVPLFVDACASLGRLPLPTGWAVAAGSAHKWGGPPGVGVLLVRRGTRWRDRFAADDRIDPHSPGFEDVPGALAAAAALQAMAEGDAEHARQFALIERLRAGLLDIPDVDVPGDPADRMPHLLTASFLYVDGEALVLDLDRRGFEVASGSACAVESGVPSRVLRAMGALTHGNLRISVDTATTAADVDALCAAVAESVADLRGAAGVLP